MAGPADSNTGDAPDKAAWRATVRQARARLPAADRAAAAAALERHLLGRIIGLRRVAAYVPVGTEPGSPRLVDLLAKAGIAVLLPVVRPDRTLDWAQHDGSRPGAGLVDARWGLREPAGPRLGPTALATVELVLVPALAADHQGGRLGRGGGHYDRALRRAEPRVPVVALLHDGELVPRLPTDGWDRPVTAAVTPSLGWTDLPLVPHYGS